MFRILSLAGGGLRGAFAIGLLEELEHRLDRPLWEYFDLIAGTSTGSITATALSSGITMRQVRQFYEQHAAMIFHPRKPYSPQNLLRVIYPWVRNFVQHRGQNPDNFFQSRYCPHSLTGAMEEGFGDMTLRDAKHCRLVVPAVNLSRGTTVVLRTPHLPIEDPSFDWRLVDVIVASSAAPTYFPHKRMPDGNDYVDGGLWANEPGVVALSEAVKIAVQCRRQTDAPFDLQDVSMLSIGTGQATYSLAPPKGDAGMLFWSKHIAQVMSISQVQGAQLPLQIVLGDRYQQVDFPLENPAWTLDNFCMTDELFGLGQQRAEELFESLQNKFFYKTTQCYTQFGMPTGN
jgi:patatin-like phospholipase/acyl hydrolase